MKRAATSSIPIAFVTGTDPVDSGLVTSLRRPEANVTGVHVLTVLLSTKRQELLHEVEQRRLIAHMPRRSNMARHAIVRLGAFLITVGMWLEQVERREVNFASRRKAASSLSGTLH